METPFIKILSVNPGAVSKLPPIEFAKQDERSEATLPLTNVLNKIKEFTGNAAWKLDAQKLALRIISGALFITLGVVQFTSQSVTMGIGTYSALSGIAVIILATLSILGIGGRGPALLLLSMGVLTAATSSTDYLTYIYMSLAIILIIFGPGRFTAAHMAQKWTPRDLQS